MSALAETMRRRFFMKQSGFLQKAGKGRNRNMRITVQIMRGGAMLVLLVLLGLIGQSGNAAGRAMAHAPASKVAQTPLPPYAGDWPMYGHDWGHTSYNPAETTISVANVNQLQSRWQV